MNVGVLGYRGRMGAKVVEEVKARGWEVIALDRGNLEALLPECNAVIEFSSPQGVEILLDKSTCPLVLASTGLSDAIKVKMKLKSLEQPLFYSANYSIGLFQMLKLLKNAGLDPARARIKETHHRHKKDVPSGTALMMQDFLKIPTSIESVREAEVVGEHEISYELGHEIFVFKHTALSRDLFASGAACALEFLLKQKAGLYSMEDLVVSLN